jgi:hypothetical protein
LTVGAVDLLENQFLADTVVIHVESSRTGTAVDGRVENGVQGAGGTGTLERELVVSA